jgi:23S rRNA (adenine-N6)-dimethyltransferase
VLTRALAGTGAEVIALELDAALAAQLRRQFAAMDQVTILEADALRWAWPARPFSVVSNLPFAQSGAILARLLRDPGIGLRRVDAIVQWEFACKHAAVWPATLRGTYLRAWFDVAIGGRLARTAFAPTPRADAAVLRITRCPRPLVAADDHDAYWRFLADAFGGQQPVRKALSPRLSPLQVKRLAPALGFAPDARPRDLDARQWAQLFASGSGRRFARG